MQLKGFTVWSGAQREYSVMVGEWWMCGWVDGEVDDGRMH